jgi:hypothetical protein
VIDDVGARSAADQSCVDELRTDIRSEQEEDPVDHLLRG